MGLLDKFRAVAQGFDSTPPLEPLDVHTLVFLRGKPQEFAKFGDGYSVIAKLTGIGLAPGDKFVFDNREYLSSLLSTRHAGLGQGEVGLVLLGELVATLDRLTGATLHALVEKHGGQAAASSSIRLGKVGVSYIVDVAEAKVSSATANQEQRPPMLVGSFSGIAEVDVDTTSRSSDNLRYVVEQLDLDVGNSAIVIGAVCTFDGQKSDNVFVQFNETLGGVIGQAKDVLRTFLAKRGLHQDGRVALAAWLMISRESAKALRVDLVLDNPPALR